MPEIQDMKDTAGDILMQASSEIKRYLGGQKDRAADSLSGVAASAHRAGDLLGGLRIEPVADLVHDVAGRGDRAIAYLKRSDIDTLTRDASDFTRENPAIVIGGALFLGLLLGRFIRSSARNSQRSLGTPNSAAVQNRLDENSAPLGDRPISAHGYVAGGVLGGAPA